MAGYQKFRTIGIPIVPLVGLLVDSSVMSLLYLYSKGLKYLSVFLFPGSAFASVSGNVSPSTTEAVYCKSASVTAQSTDCG